MVLKLVKQEVLKKCFKCTTFISLRLILIRAKMLPMILNVIQDKNVG